MASAGNGAPPREELWLSRSSFAGNDCPPWRDSASTRTIVEVSVANVDEAWELYKRISPDDPRGYIFIQPVPMSVITQPAMSVSNTCVEKKD